MQAVAISALVHVCTPWTKMKYLDKEFDPNYKRILREYIMEDKKFCCSTAIYLSSQKTSKKDEQGIIDSTGEVRMTS